MSNKYDITLADSAAKRIVELVHEANYEYCFDQDDAPYCGLRLEVKAGGCSGYQYTFELAETMEETDLLIMNGEARLVVDEQSAELLRGSTVEFKNELLSQEFVINNPNANCCGCGRSFS